MKRAPEVVWPEPEAIEAVAEVERTAPPEAEVDLARSVLGAAGFASVVATAGGLGAALLGRWLGLVTLAIGFAAGVGARSGGSGRVAQGVAVVVAVIAAVYEAAVLIAAMRWMNGQPIGEGAVAELLVLLGAMWGGPGLLNLLIAGWFAWSLAARR
jgi:hypothetical protein